MLALFFFLPETTIHYVYYMYISPPAARGEGDKTKKYLSIFLFIKSFLDGKVETAQKSEGKKSLRREVRGEMMSRGKGTKDYK